MLILNTKNPEDVAKIYPWLSPTGTMTRMEVATDLYRRLKDEPEDTLLLVAINRNITRAVYAACMTRGRRKCVSVLQAQAEEEFHCKDLIETGIKDWARSKKAREIKYIDGERVKL